MPKLLSDFLNSPSNRTALVYIGMLAVAWIMHTFYPSAEVDGTVAMVTGIVAKILQPDNSVAQQDIKSLVSDAMLAEQSKNTPALKELVMDASATVKDWRYQRPTSNIPEKLMPNEIQNAETIASDLLNIAAETGNPVALAADAALNTGKNIASTITADQASHANNLTIAEDAAAKLVTGAAPIVAALPAADASIAVNLLNDFQAAFAALKSFKWF